MCLFFWAFVIGLLHVEREVKAFQVHAIMPTSKRSSLWSSHST
jgi:hypothetical protein